MPALTNGGHELFLGEGYSLIPNLAIKRNIKNEDKAPTDEKKDVIKIKGPSKQWI